MLKVSDADQIEFTERSFRNCLPEYLQRHSRRFFTPIHIAKTAAQWLTEDGNKRVLDIGAGVGKFCISAAKSCRHSYFSGIEYRSSLARIANDLIIDFGVENASVQHGDVTEVDFESFDAFYMYNPFFENLVPALRLNNETELFASLYSYYSKRTEEKLNKTKQGTRLVTFHGNNFEVPDSFKRVRETTDGLLKLWVKE